MREIRARRYGLWAVLLSIEVLANSCSHADGAALAGGAGSIERPALAAVSSPAARGGAAVAETVCLRDGEERKLEIFGSETGCSLKYSKLGKSREVASSRVGKKHCQRILAKMKSHLEEAGFQCGT